MATPSAPERSPLQRLQVVVRPGPFRRYMAGESLSTTGTWMQIMAESWVLTGLTHSAFVMGLVSFAAGVPALLLTMFGGSVADRFDKRTILLLTQVAQIALAVTMGVLVWTGVVQIWMIVILEALLGAVTAFEMPAASALVPELVAKDEIADALAVDRSTFHATRMVGPALAGLVIGAFGAAFAFFANAFSFVGLMLALWTLPKRVIGTVEEEEARSSGMGDGLAFVRQEPGTFAMLALMTLMTLIPVPVLLVLLPLYARTQLALGATEMGLMMSLNAGGALLGSIWLLHVKRDSRIAMLGLVILGLGAGLFGLGVFKSFLLAGISLFIMSICLATQFGLVNTIIQERAPGPLRGRISALAGLTFFGLQPFAALVVTWFADRIGMSLAFEVAGPIYAVLALVVLAGPGRQAGIPLPEAAPLEPAALATS